MRTRVPLFKLPRHTGKYVRGIFKSGWYAPGPLGRLLKTRLAEMFPQFSRDQIVLTSSATAAFGAVLALVRWSGSNRQIAISDSTWVGMYRVLEGEGFARAGFEQADVFVDSDLGGATTQDFKESGPNPPWRIQDCCHGWIPRQGYDFCISSFYPTKLVPGAEGGVIFCSSHENAHLLEKQINCGLGPLWESPSPGQSRSYEEAGHAIGRKATMPDMLAALNLEALEGHWEYAAKIKRSWRLLEAAAMGVGIRYRFQETQPYLFQVELPPGPGPSVPRVQAELFKRGVETAWNFPPLNLVTVPCFPGMQFSTAVGIMKDVRRVLDGECRLLGKEMAGKVDGSVRPELAGSERAPAGAEVHQGATHAASATDQDPPG